jgi:hypothetical protein
MIAVDENQRSFVPAVSQAVLITLHGGFAAAAWLKAGQSARKAIS